jgi:hypothetical protein
MTRFALAAACAASLWVLGNSPLWADNDTDKAALLVRQLGNGSFQLREDASRSLLKLGRPAKQALLDGLKINDPEVRSRCERILVLVLEQDFKARLDGFIADKEGKYEHDLPAWGRYRKLVGGDASARELYVEMAQSQRQLLEDFESEPKAVGDKYGIEVQALFQKLWGPNVAQRKQISTGDVAAMLLIGADPEVTLNDQVRALTVNLLYQPAFSQGIRTGPRVEPLKKLLGGWITQASGQSAVQMLNLAIQYNLKDGLDLALRLIRDKEFAGGMSIVAVGKLGTKEHLAVLEPLLSNETLVANVNFNNKPGTAEVRDVALAMMVHLSGQPIKDFGFEFFRGANNDQVFFAPAYLAFSDKAKREAALKKWQEFAAKQK